MAGSQGQVVRRVVMVMLLGALPALWFGWAVGAARGEVSEGDVRKMTEACPQTPTVRPAKPRRLLVYTACTGFRHGSIPYASRALQIMGEKTGAFEAVVSDDMGMFEPEKLKDFDAVCMNNTTGELFGLKKGTDAAALPPDTREKVRRLRESLLNFVRGGKGIVGIHAATDCSYGWPQYGEMMGAYFDGHPWNEDVAVKVDDPEHPLCAAFKGRGFTIKDEIYQFKEPYSRKRLRVLLSLDMAKTKPKGKRKDNDYAVAWVSQFGKGRVFYCSLGHRNEIFWNPLVLRFYLDGIQFALGDLEADTAPSAAETDPTAPADSAAAP